MLNGFEVLETNTMIERDLLDVRTITMGISLLGCIDSDKKKLEQNIYDCILRRAGKLVETGEAISREYGIPIVNKRVSVTPIALIGGSACRSKEDFAEIAETLDRAAKEIGVNFIGGYSALVVKETAARTAENGSLGCAKLVIFCNAPDDNPFMAGAFHGVTEGDAVIHVGVSGPGVVRAAVQQTKGQSFEVLCETIKKTAFKITRVGQLVAREASRRLDTPFGIIDLSLAPTPADGDSVADILEAIGLEAVGAPGTTAALALLNDQVKKGGVMASSYVGGLSGAFIPVSEDQGMIRAAECGALSLEKLEAMTCVCSVGLDMIAVPGDTSAETITGIIADEAAIGMINQKTTAVRLIPAHGKKVGDVVEFGGLLGHAPVIAVNPYGCADFVRREGRIPAPIHSFKN